MCQENPECHRSGGSRILISGGLTMDCNWVKRKAYDEIMSIFRMMANVGVSMYVVPFRMQELMREYDISKFEVDMLRREVLYEINYNII